MKNWTARTTHVAGLLLAIGAAFASHQGCGGEDAEGCSGGKTSCGGRCVDTSTDPSHCGGCNMACPVGEECVGGQCQCPAGTSRCSGVCINTATDPANCGGCGGQCDEFQICVGGECECPEGLAPCSSGCADLTSDKLNCGQCNLSCLAAQSCINSNCVCPDGTELCYSQCVDTNTDAHFCGDCETRCDYGDFCNGGDCETISSCSQVPEDQYEGNDTCSLARPLPIAPEGAPAVTIGDATLHHVDGSLDTDWFGILAKEGTHICNILPPEPQCYFTFDIAFTPPDPAAYQVYEMCVYSDTCTGDEFCTTGADWNSSAGRYELGLSWQGLCGLTDDTNFFVKISRSGGEESCMQYSLEYQMGYTDEVCP